MKHALSYGMRLLQVMDGLEPGSVLGPAFTATAVYRLTGRISPAILQLALDDLVSRHAALRTELTTRPRILPTRPAMLTVAFPDSLAQFLADRPAGGPPEPPLPPLWAHLGFLGEDDVVLMLGAHHATADAWSLELLMRDLQAVYRARVARARMPAAFAPTYADLATRARNPAAEARIRTALDYWRRQLAGLPAPTPGSRSGERERFSWRTDTDIVALARKKRTSPFVVLLAALASALHHCYGAGDLVIPVLTAGRGPREWETVGWFINLLPVRIRVDPKTDLIAHVHHAFADACRHEVPCTRLLEAVPALGELLTVVSPATPVFQAIQLPPLAASAPYRRVEVPAQVPTSGDGPWDHVWTIRLTEGTQGWITHDTGLLATDTVKALVMHMEEAIQHAL